MEELGVGLVQKQLQVLQSAHAERQMQWGEAMHIVDLEAAV